MYRCLWRRRWTQGCGQDKKLSRTKPFMKHLSVLDIDQMTKQEFLLHIPPPNFTITSMSLDTQHMRTLSIFAPLQSPRMMLLVEQVVQTCSDRADSPSIIHSWLHKSMKRRRGKWREDEIPAAITYPYPSRLSGRSGNTIGGKCI